MRINAALTRVFRNWPAKVLSFAGALLLLVFHDITRLEERFVTVPLELQLSDRFMPGAAYPQQVRVRLRGESDEVFRIVEDDLRAYVDLRRFGDEGEYRVPVQVERTTSAPTDGVVEITPEPAWIQLELEEKLLTSVEVVATTSGFPPSGYELVQILMTPSSVEIEGPRSRVELVDAVRTEDVDLSTRRGDFTERLRLVQPDPLIRFPGGDIVEMRGFIEEAVVLQTFSEVGMVVFGLPDGLELRQALPTGTIRVQARQIDLETVSRGDLQLTVDASVVDGPGTVRLPVRPIVPSGFTVLGFEPTSVQVVIGADGS